MSEVVLIHGDAWKVADIADDVAWCRTVHWLPSRYTKTGDHSHCSICWWTLAESEDANVGEGFVSQEQKWVCKECHEKFIAVAGTVAP